MSPAPDPKQDLAASDCGADLEKGISLFCPGRPTRRVKDIAHAAANAVKRELNGNA